MHTPDQVGPRCTKDGHVELTPEEKQAKADEWNAKEAKRNARQVHIDALKAAGFSVNEARLAKKLGLRPDIVEIIDALDALD